MQKIMWQEVLISKTKWDGNRIHYDDSVSKSLEIYAKS